MSLESKETISVKPWIWPLFVILITLFLVPFASIMLALKKSQVLEQPSTTSSRPDHANSLPRDNSTLRILAEKQAEESITVPQLAQDDSRVVITVRGDQFQKAVQSVRQHLLHNGFASLEEPEPDGNRMVFKVLVGNDRQKRGEFLSALRESAHQIHAIGITGMESADSVEGPEGSPKTKGTSTLFVGGADHDFFMIEVIAAGIP